MLEILLIIAAIGVILYTLPLLVGFFGIVAGALFYLVIGIIALTALFFIFVLISENFIFHPFVVLVFIGCVFLIIYFTLISPKAVIFDENNTNNFNPDTEEVKDTRFLNEGSRSIDEVLKVLLQEGLTAENFSIKKLIVEEGRKPEYLNFNGKLSDLTTLERFDYNETNQIENDFIKHQKIINLKLDEFKNFIQTYEENLKSVLDKEAKEGKRLPTDIYYSDIKDAKNLDFEDFVNLINQYFECRELSEINCFRILCKNCEKFNAFRDIWNAKGYEVKPSKYVLGFEISRLG